MHERQVFSRFSRSAEFSRDRCVSLQTRLAKHNFRDISEIFKHFPRFSFPKYSVPESIDFPNTVSHSRSISQIQCPRFPKNAAFQNRYQIQLSKRRNRRTILRTIFRTILRKILTNASGKFLQTKKWFSALFTRRKGSVSSLGIHVQDALEDAERRCRKAIPEDDAEKPKMQRIFRMTVKTRFSFPNAPECPSLWVTYTQVLSSLFGFVFFVFFVFSAAS